MATLQKFKHFASQCGASTGNPTQSPTTSPVFHLRHHRHRRNTLRMLLSRGGTPDRHRRGDIQAQQRDLPTDSHRARRKLKDLFVSSPPFDDHRKQNRGCDEVRLLTEGGVGSNSSGGGGGGGLRPAAARFRYRLLRRAWRPVLVTIPE
ncbi:hypothetical protein LINPERPRIM_LOCUS2850 [Linum perenne]